jgi:hypothetical protein
MAGVTVATHDSTRCIPERLTGFIDELRTRFGSVQINSAYRNRSHNRQVGGARGSQHINCNAIDFVVPGVPKSEVRQFLIANFVGRAGVGFYCGNRFHLDVGPVRQWGGCPPGSDEIATARRRYSRYLTQRTRLNNIRVSEANLNHRGYHRHANDNRIFVQRSAL